MTSHVERYTHIAEVLTRHGLGFLVGVTGLSRWIPFHRGLLGHEPQSEPYTQPQHLRLALEELGPAFIKLGQLLSTRSDMLPAEYLSELSKLQDAAPPVPVADVIALIVQELGAAPEDVFANFDPKPLASASIGQAHSATLDDGTAVVVKVRRPGIVPMIETDLEILQNLAAQASRRWAAAADYNLVGLAAEFAESLRSELDYLREGRNAERFAQDFAGDPEVHIPRVFWATTTSRVLTLERVTGMKVTDADALTRAGIDRESLARRAAGIAVTMVFENGFFHADPHPGNLFIEADGRVGLIDFGMVGKIDEELRGQLGALLAALAATDVDRIAEALLDLAVSARPASVDRLRQDLSGFVSLYRGRRIGQVSIGPLLTRMLALLRTHHLQLPRDVPMLFKFCLMVESMGVGLDPEFNLGEFLQPYVQRWALNRFSPQVFARRLAASARDAAELAIDLPAKVQHLVDLIDRSGVEVHLREAEVETVMDRLEQIGNRLVAGMIAAAFIRGIGELATNSKRWGTWEKPLMNVGIGASTALGAYLAWTGHRTGHRRR